MRKILPVIMATALVSTTAWGQQKRDRNSKVNTLIEVVSPIDLMNTGCDSIGWPIAQELSLAAFLQSQNRGAYVGPNIFGDQAKGNFFDLSGSSANFLNRAIIGNGVARGAGGVNINKPVVFRVLDGTTNSPGSELASISTNLEFLNSLQRNFIFATFSPAIALPASKKIFLVASFPGLEWKGPNAAENDTLIFIHSDFDEPANNLAWEQWEDGRWFPFTDQNSWQGRMVIHTYPLVSQSADGCVLPVTFGMLSATPRTGSVDVSWTTYTETNNLYFEVERSTDARQFTPIGRVDSKSKSGDFQGVLNYTLTDANPSAGTNFYRIRQVDRDGSSSYSDVAKAVVSTTVANHPVAAYYPNPTGSRMVVQLKEGSRAVESVRFSDVSGRVSGQYKPAVAPDGQMILPTAGLRKGMHLLTITFSGGEQTTLKVVKE